MTNTDLDEEMQEADTVFEARCVGLSASDVYFLNVDSTWMLPFEYSMTSLHALQTDSARLP